MLVLVLYFFLLVFFDRTLFSPRPGRLLDEADGFEQTILWVLMGEAEPPIWLLARLAVISPILYLDGLILSPILQGLYLLLYSLPVALWVPPRGRRSALQIFLVLIPIFINFRLAIAIYAVAFCLIFMVDRRVNPWAFLWFSLPLFLSSSTMFIYLLYFPILAISHLRLHGRLFKLGSWFLYLAIADQFFEKIVDLFDRSIAGEVLSTASAVGLDYSGSGSGFVFALLTGNPFYTAMVAGQYDRLLILIPSFIFAIGILVKLYLSGNSRVLLFVAIVLASMASEGVGSYSVGVVMALILLHRRYFFAASIRSRFT